MKIALSLPRSYSREVPAAGLPSESPGKLQ